MTTFVTFATPDYVRHLCGLVESMLPHRLPFEASVVSRSGAWAETCARKPGHLLERWSWDPLCWLDADARVRAYPALLVEGLRADVAWHRFGVEDLSGTLWVSGTRRAKRFLEAWHDRCTRAPQTWDQHHLAGALEESGATHAELPAEYCWIHDLSPKRYGAADPVIEHLQASRESRHK